ncbi:MAG: acetyltransferase [Firmicutes bacterium]|nr:acetyltransferase [Bacillota bacterium]
MKIGIVGAGGHGRVVLDLILESCGMEPAGFFDQKISGEGPYGWPILGDETSLVENWPGFRLDGVVVAIGENRTRRRIFEILSAKGIPLVSIIHRQAQVSRFARIGAGTVICAGAVVGPGAVIGDNSIINTGASVDHDCRVKDHAHLCPGSVLAGTVTVGEEVMLGTGTVVIPGITIGNRTITGAGSVVIQDLPDNLLVAGVPVRLIRHLEEEKDDQGKKTNDRSGPGKKTGGKSGLGEKTNGRSGLGKKIN